MSCETYDNDKYTTGNIPRHVLILPKNIPRILKRPRTISREKQRGESAAGRTVIGDQPGPWSQQQQNLVPPSLDQLDGSCVSDSLGGFPIDFNYLVPNLPRKQHNRVSLYASRMLRTNF